MKIEVLGTGCTMCNSAEAIVKEAIAKSGVDAKVIKVQGRMAIAKAGVQIKPSVIENGQVMIAGKIPEIGGILK